jgi:hypothetical protein
MTIRSIAFPAILAATALADGPCTGWDPPGGGSTADAAEEADAGEVAPLCEPPFGYEEEWAGVEFPCKRDQALRCVPMAYWMEDSFCVAGMDIAQPSGVMVKKVDCYTRPWCTEAGTGLKFVLTCVNLNTPCGSLITSPAFVPLVQEVCE